MCDYTNRGVTTKHRTPPSVHSLNALLVCACHLCGQHAWVQAHTIIGYNMYTTHQLLTFYLARLFPMGNPLCQTCQTHGPTRLFIPVALTWPQLHTIRREVKLSTRSTRIAKVGRSQVTVVHARVAPAGRWMRRRLQAQALIKQSTPSYVCNARHQNSHVQVME